MLHGAVPQPPANDAAARQNVAALTECTSSLPARTPAAAAPIAPAVAAPPHPPTALANGHHTAHTPPQPHHDVPSITTCDALNLSALSVSVERRSAFQSVRADCRPPLQLPHSTPALSLSLPALPSLSLSLSFVLCCLLLCCAVLWCVTRMAFH